MRIINLRLQVTNDMGIFYKNMEQHGFSYTFIQKYLCDLLHDDVKETNEKIIKECVKIFRYYRNEVGNSYNASEFALADKMRFFPLYVYALLSQECLNYKIIKPKDEIFNTLLMLK